MSDRVHETLSPAEAAALRFALDYELWQSKLWVVVNDAGYRSVPMAEQYAKECAGLWHSPADAPFRAEPMPRPVLQTEAEQ